MFITTELETILSHLNKLTADQSPLWGNMSAQRMVEHLTDTLRIATGKNPQDLLVPEEKIDKMVAFLESDKPMALNIEVPFATPEMKLRNEEIELAIDELVDEWLQFEELYENNPNHTEIHPYYGPLNGQQWMRLNAKHLTHHFKQFGLIEE
jgi:hypothetical protein